MIQSSSLLTAAFPVDFDSFSFYITNNRVYSSKTDKNPQFGRIKQIGGI